MKKRIAKKICDYDYRRNFSYYEHENPYDRYSKQQVHTAYRKRFGSGLLGYRMPRFRIIEGNSLADIEEFDDSKFLSTIHDSVVVEVPS